MTGRAAAKPFVHASAIVDGSAALGPGTRVWAFAQVRDNARVGSECTIGQGAYVGAGVVVGDRCKIHTNALIFEGVTIEDQVFVGPGAMFTNDESPRATNPDGTVQTENDWELGRGIVRRGASLGAGAIVLPGREIGRYAMIGAGAVVTENVPPHAVLVGNPGRIVAWACLCGRGRFTSFDPDADGILRCPRCLR